jgi:hypothetical protein
MSAATKYLRRKQAVEYLWSQYGFGSLHMLTHADGPRYVIVCGAATYAVDVLDSFAAKQMKRTLTLRHKQAIAKARAVHAAKLAAAKSTASARTIPAQT